MKNSYLITLLLLGVFLASAVQLLEAQVPAIDSAGNATAQVAVPFTYRITATNSPTSYSIISTVPSSLVQSIYRGAFGDQTTASGKIWMSGSGQEFPNGPAFAAITSNGSAVAWGNPNAGGNATVVSSSLTSNVTAIYSSSQAFAALKSNGSVVTWGDALSGGSTSGAVGGNLTSGVISISSTTLAFAALKSNGSVVTWGNPDFGGNSTSRVGGNLTSNVTAVFSNAGAFAALKSNGSVVTWGDPWAGGNSTLFELDQDFNTVETSVASQLTSGVVSINSAQGAFAARKSDGSVVTWGDMAASGAYTPPSAGSLSSNVTAVFSNDNAFAALKSNGSVVTWGASMSGGDSSYVSANLTSGVTAIYSNPSAFAALKSNGSVVTWGMPISGGVSSFPVGGNLTSGVKSISSTQFAFAALKNNGSVVTWGEDMSGGDSSISAPPSNFGPPIAISVANLLTSNVTAIYATQSAFAALKSDGSVVTWGFSDLGGDSTSVAQLLTSNVTAIAANSGAFAALKRNGSIVTWGSSAPGDIPAPANIGAPAADITSLTGLSFNSANGSLSGSPTKSGNFSLRLGATNASGTGNAPFSLLILPASGMSLSGNLSFGNVFVGQNATRNFSIYNPSSGPLTVTAITSSNAPLFALVGNSSNLTVASGASQNVTVRFQPSVAGTFSSNITVASNAGNSILPAVGTGISAAPQISVTGDLAFGNVTVNQTANRTLSIKNNSSGNITVGLPTHPEWLQRPPLTVTGSIVMTGNSTMNIPYSFRPTSDQSYSGNLTLSTSAGNFTIPASGKGIHSRIISLTGNLSFGSVGVNATANRTLSISNTGTGPLSVTGISYPTGFSGNWSSGTIAANATQNVTVSFRPATPGNFNGTITVNSTATSGNATIATSGTGVLAPVITGNLSASGAVGGNFSYQITASNNPTSFGNATALPAGLSLNATTGLISGKPTAAGNSKITLRANNAGGTGTANLTVAISPSRIISLSGNFSFGNATVNSTLTRNLTITNSGTGNLTVTGISYPQGFSGNWNGTITPNSTRNVTVSFRPPNEGPFNGTITVNSTATSGNSTISASGTGVHSRIISLTGNLSFGSVGLNATANRTLSIRNTGTGPLNVSGISYPTDFSGNFSGTITPNTTQNVTVSFRPTTAGNFTGSITVNSTATSGNSSIAASGTGVLAPVINGNLSASGVIGANFSYQITATNNPTSFGNATALPAGLILNATTGLISGTPATVGNTTVTLTASNAGGTGNATLALRIAAAPLATSQFTGGKLGSPLVNGLNDIDGDGINDVSLADLGSFAAIDATGGYGLTGESGGGAAWVRGNSTIVAPDQAGKNEAFFSPFRGNIMSSSDNWSKVRFSSGDGWVQWKFAAGSSPVIPLVFVREASAQNLSAAQAWEAANRGPAITSAASANGSVGTAFNFQVTASNNATSFSASSLPAGLTINATTGLISGTPTAVGSSIITLSATNASGIGVVNLTLTISPSRIIGLTGNLSFGNATVNSTSTRNLTITNTGTGNLTITGISYPQGFSGNWNGTITPNSTRNVTVSFRPPNEGPFNGTITVNSTATSGNSTISASGTGVHTRIIALSGDLAFGSALANRTLDKNPTRTLTISNSGTGNLTITRIERPAGFRVFASLPDPSLGGNYTTVNFTSSGFSVSLAELTGNFTLPIAAGTSKSLLVAFSPTAAAAYSGNITVASNASNAASNSARAASGTGVTSPLSITGNLSFGNVTVNQQAQRTLSITNLDSVSHALSLAIGASYSVALSPFPYNVMGNPVTLQAGATVNATVTFFPTSATAHSGNLSIISATAGNRTITASGTATHSRIIGLTGNLSFGSLPVNQTANRTLSIRNTGTGPLNVTGITYPTGISGNWSSGTIAANATQNITVSFRPTNENPVTGNITVTSDATSGTPTIPASGTGIHSRIIGLTGNLSFGTLTVNQTANRTLTISNTGTAPFNVTGITYPAGFSGNFSGTINPNTTQNVTISFRPATPGNFTGTISVNSTATSGNSSITATGTAILLPVITTTNLHGTKGLTFSQRILATNNATTFGNATALPLGLTINRTTGLISGTMPTGPLISFSVNITATNAYGATSAPVTFWFWDDLLSVAGGALKTSNELNNTMVPTFRIGKYEVTWFEWKAVREWAVANGYADLANVGEGSGDLHPVRDVNWYDVVKWCNAKSERDGLTPVYTVGAAVYKTGQSVPTVNIAAKGYRLPTEAEWEWAARGGVGGGNYTYSGSNDVNSVAWYAFNSAGGTKQFATKKANDLGIHDMSGNVAEWCWDSVSSDRRTLGGSFGSLAFGCSLASRGWIRTPDSRDGDSGLRLARSLDEPTSVYGTVGIPVSYQLAAFNNPTSFSNSTALPAGLSLNATTGLISGTPMVAGNSTVTLRASNAGVTGTANVTFSIKPDLITVQGGTLPQSSALWGTPVSTFRIGTFEVTRSLWQIVRTWGVANGYTDLPSIDPGSNGNCPVQQVSWYDAVKWCNARSAMEGLTPVYTVNSTVYKTGVKDPAQNTAANGYRLPTEAEWEWAARGGTLSKGYSYSGSNDLNAVGWYYTNSSGAAFGSVRLWPVGQKAANELGIFDASGNVKEWCWDVWTDDGKISRRQRGGSWSSADSQCAFTNRGGSPYPQDRYDDIGFRLARKSGN